MAAMLVRHKKYDVMASVTWCWYQVP